MAEEEDVVEEYDSGPFCEHWADPNDCEEVCAICKHECRQHRYDSCSVEGCKCEQFINEAPEN